jgi:hypothetical protein
VQEVIPHHREASYHERALVFLLVTSRSWEVGHARGGRTASRGIGVVVETEVTEREAQGMYTLELWDEGGSRLVSLGRLAFP